jgi:hypothetical protein
MTAARDHVAPLLCVAVDQDRERQRRVVGPEPIDARDELRRPFIRGVLIANEDDECLGVRRRSKRWRGQQNSREETGKQRKQGRFLDGAIFDRTAEPANRKASGASGPVGGRASGASLPPETEMRPGAIEAGFPV